MLDIVFSKENGSGWYLLLEFSSLILYQAVSVEVELIYLRVNLSVGFVVGVVTYSRPQASSSSRGEPLLPGS